MALTREQAAADIRAMRETLLVMRRKAEEIRDAALASGRADIGTVEWAEGLRSSIDGAIDSCDFIKVGCLSGSVAGATAA